MYRLPDIQLALEKDNANKIEFASVVHILSDFFYQVSSLASRISCEQRTYQMLSGRVKFQNKTYMWTTKCTLGNTLIMQMQVTTPSELLFLFVVVMLFIIKLGPAKIMFSKLIFDTSVTRKSSK